MQHAASVCNPSPECFMQEMVTSPNMSFMLQARGEMSRLGSMQTVKIGEVMNVVDHRPEWYISRIRRE